MDPDLPNKISCCRKIVVVIVVIVKLGAMVGKVMIAQTLARRTQWDFNMLTVANGETAFLNIVT